MVDLSKMAVDPAFKTFGQAAIYTNAAETVSTSVTVISKRPDEIIGALSSSIHSKTALFELRSSEVATPDKGGKITLGADVYIIQSSPIYADDLRFIWLLNTYPEGA